MDYAFKRIFGTEKYKDATIQLLNSLLPDRNIVDVTYLNTEIIGTTGTTRKSAIDVLCEDNDGAKFIVEMQNAEQSHFMERTVFYASRVISMLGKQGRNYDYSISPNYVIDFLNFKMDRIEGNDGNGGQYYLHVQNYSSWPPAFRDPISFELLCLRKSQTNKDRAGKGSL